MTTLLGLFDSTDLGPNNTRAASPLGYVLLLGGTGVGWLGDIMLMLDIRAGEARTKMRRLVELRY